MNVRGWIRACAVFTGALSLGGCGSLLETTLPAPQAYVLRLAPQPTPAATGTSAGSVLVQRPEAGPGLDSDGIALLRSEQRFDFYAASRWAAPTPDVVESLIIDALRGSGAFAAVFDDSSPYAPQYVLRVTLRRFEADYTKGGGAPMVHVALDCTLGRHRDRALLASFTAQGSAQAGEDRLNSVVAAFGTAASAAMNELTQAATAAVANEPPPAASAKK
jgi:cholesterol transport system auxiliary component